jgi:pantetheine-phosphate adenylyltransferase
VRRALCPGSFDPITNGHLDIIERASRMFDEVVVAVGINAAKGRLFSLDERLDMIRANTAGLDNVRVDAFSGLVVDYCSDHGIQAIVKGLRSAGDYEYELPMAQMNARMSGVETVFLATDPRFGYVSSSLMKVVLGGGGDASELLPASVIDRVRQRQSELGA